MHELFEEQAERAFEALAVVYEDHSLTYGELNRQANRLAHHLRALGVRPDSRVGICVERSLEMVVGLLAILKAGGAYVPLDPAYPAERLSYMLSDSAPAIVLTHGPARASLDQALAHARSQALDQEDNSAGLDMPVLDLQADANDWSIHPATNPDPKAVGLTPHNLAYIIYTSGSTGLPKGVMVEHEECQSTSLDAGSYEHRLTDRVWTQIPFFSFDLSVWEICRALS